MKQNTNFMIMIKISMILYEAFICNIFLLPKIRMDKKVAIQQTFTITNIWK